MAIESRSEAVKSGFMVNNSHVHERCTVCGSRNIVRNGKISYPAPVVFADTLIEFSVTPELWECSDCMSRFVQYSVPEHDAGNFYSSKTSQRWTSPLPFEERRTDKLVEMVKRYLRGGLHVLDIGCSTGAFLTYAKEKGCLTHGTESSVTARDTASASGHDCRASLEDFGKDILFDAVFCFDVIEHVYSVKDFLDKFALVLKPGGIFFILTGDVRCGLSRVLGSRWWYVRYPEHISFPSAEYLSRLPQFEMIDNSRTFAFRHQEGPLFKKYLKMIVRSIQNKYHGYASPFPDHMAVVLRKK